MIELFTNLTAMLYSSWWLAILSSFIWGILSIILSPCHLSSIPLLIGFINDSGTRTKGKSAQLSTLFALGILITLGIIGGITGSIGRILGDIGPIGNIFVGILLIFFGIYLLGIFNFSFLENGIKPTIKKKGALTAFLLGLMFGIALGPCTFAFIAPMLGIVFSTVATNILFAVLLLSAFAIGHCLVIVLAGTFTGAVREFLNWNEKSGIIIWIKRICGVLLIITAVYFIFF